MDGKNGSRFEVFGELKKEIRGSESHLIVGIDIAKTNHRAFFGTATGKTLLKRLVFSNDAGGFSKLLTYVAAGLAWFALSSQVGWAGLADDIKRVAENFGIEMTDKPTTFEVRDNGMSNRVWHKGKVAQAGTLNLRGCGQLQSKDGDPVEFVRYSPSMVAVKNLRTGKQCIAQHGPQP